MNHKSKNKKSKRNIANKIDKKGFKKKAIALKSKIFERFLRKRNRSKKKAIALETLAWWIIALLVLAVIVVAIIILRGKGTSIMNYLKDLMRFGGK